MCSELLCIAVSIGPERKWFGCYFCIFVNLQQEPVQSKFSIIQICASPYCFFYLLLNIQSSFLPFLKMSYVGSYPVDLYFICIDCFFRIYKWKHCPASDFFKLSGKSGKMAVLILFKTNKNTTELLYFEVHLLSSIFALIMHLVTRHNQMNTQLLTVV